MMGRVVHIFVAPTRGAPMEPCTTVTAIANTGLVGDRYAKLSNRRGPEYQLTLIEIENIEAFAKSVGRPFTPDMPRRNVVTQGVALNALCGYQFQVGEAVLEGIELCEPCSLFSRRAGREVLKGFLHRGGLRTRIVEGGEIWVGDGVGFGELKLD
jgi:MOSC domain-containing protein YiiM